MMASWNEPPEKKSRHTTRNWLIACAIFWLLFGLYVWWAHSTPPCYGSLCSP